ncbi:DNA adenine methylase [Paenibacillus tianjinensis]|uniref:DNA adenine methylase n=1 Tax=Paenibacillus tianjinensis TaxID=2810347 RepID=UPI002FC85F60
MNSPIKWRGGKRNLRKEIIEMIPEHHCYVEPFAGGLWVLFGKDKSKTEVINDIDKNLINFYSVLKNNYNEFIKKFNTYLVSRDEFEYLKNADEEEMDELMLAYKFFYINKNSFGGDMSSFNSYYRDTPYMNDSALKLLKKAHERLKTVWVENRDYTEIIKKFDKPDSFFFFDPPYYETNNGSYKNGKNIDFEVLQQQLKSIKGKFLLTVNDNTYIRELMKDFYINEVEVQYNMSKDASGRGKFGELIVTNYEVAI